jgi:hypothetical protein
MTQDEIIEMAIQGHASTRDAIRWAMNQEREACAKLCDSTIEQTYISGYTGAVHSGRRECANQIRARGQAC